MKQEKNNTTYWENTTVFTFESVVWKIYIFFAWVNDMFKKQVHKHEHLYLYLGAQLLFGCCGQYTKACSDGGLILTQSPGENEGLRPWREALNLPFMWPCVLWTWALTFWSPGLLCAVAVPYNAPVLERLDARTDGRAWLSEALSFVWCFAVPAQRPLQWQKLWELCWCRVWVHCCPM